MDQQTHQSLTVSSVDRPGFFGKLAQAVIDLFGPVKDDYPETGVQPFTGKLGR